MASPAAVAVVSGATGAIGRAIAARLLDQHYTVHLLSRQPSRLDTLLASLGQPGRCVAHVVDLADPESLTAFCRRGMPPRVDVLVHAAGVAGDVVFARGDARRAATTLATNLEAGMALSQAALRRMLGRRGAAAAPAGEPAADASIVHVGSVLGRRGRAGQAVYSASKAGLEGLTRGLAAEYGPRGIRTNLVAPGWIATAMTDAYPADTVAEIRARIPLGRLGSPDEVADAVMFLVTNRYMNGATLTLDGGLASSL